MVRNPSHWLLLLLALGLSPGCGPKGTTAPAGPKVVSDPARLAVSDHLPPLDGGRIEIAPPKGWRVAPQSRDYLVRFFLDATMRTQIPRIWVLAEASPFEGMDEITAANVEAFTEKIADRLGDDPSVIERPKPMIIGDNACVRFVMLTRFNAAGRPSLTAERQVLQTVRGGRLYTIELHVVQGTILKYRDTGYAVMASLRAPQPLPAATPPS